MPAASNNHALDEFTEVERYELREKPPYHFQANRREFVQVMGAGLVIAVSCEPAEAQRRGGGRSPARRDERLTDRFHIADTGIVTVLTSKVEFGQDARTQITQAVAEELRLPVDQIRVVMGDTERCPDDGGTAGSRTTPSTVPRVRSSAAALRELLLKYAAEQLQTDLANLKVDGGTFSDGDQQLTLAELAKDERLLERLDTPAGESAIVPVEQWLVLGTPVQSVKGREVVTGAAAYPSDIQRPDMLYGKVLRSASFGATLTSVDTSAAEAMPGVVVVRDENFIGCAAPTSWQADAALRAIRATANWDRPEHPSSDTLFEHLKQHADGGGRFGGFGSRGDASSGASSDASAPSGRSERRLDAAYTVAYIQHAPMEPRAAVAEWQDGRLTVWTGTQQPSRVHGELSQAFRLSADRVRVIVPDTGGGFGGKHTGEVAVEVARLAKAAGRPVSLRWTREEEFTWAYYRPAGLIEVKASIDAAGKLATWDFTNYNSGGSAIETPYRVSGGRSRYVGSDSPLRQGSYRALASTANTFAREAAMDELAAMAGADPLEFRLQHLDDGRLKDVLRATAERFNWRTRRVKRAESGRTPGRGIGLACGTEKGSYVAACVEVEVTDGRIKLLAVCEGFECGAIQNPRNLRQQVIGCTIMGIGGAMTEEIKFESGKITNASFSSYLVPRISDVPEIDVLLLDRHDLPSVGAGETPIIAIAPAIANAVADATGKRLRSMPMKL